MVVYVLGKRKRGRYCRKFRPHGKTFYRTKNEARKKIPTMESRNMFHQFKVLKLEVANGSK